MFRRAGIVSMIALTSFLFCGFTEPTSCKSSGGGGGLIVAGAVGAVAVVAVAVTVPLVIVHNKHTVSGCVFRGPEGLKVQDPGTGDENGNGRKNYALSGLTDSIKDGDMVKLHGTKSKHGRHDVGDQGFVVEKVSKDYGPCKVPAVMPKAKTAENGQDLQSVPRGTL